MLAFWQTSFKKGKNPGQIEEEGEKRVRKRGNTKVRGGGAPWQNRYSQSDCAPQRTHARAEKSEKEGEAERNYCILTPTPASLVAALKELKESRGDNKAGGNVTGVKE